MKIHKGDNVRVIAGKDKGKTGGGGKKQGQVFAERAEAEGISVITAIILEVTEFLTKVIGSVSFLVLIIAGIWMIISLGNEQQVTKAKGMFTYAILGLVIALAAYVFVIAIQGLLTE